MGYGHYNLPLFKCAISHRTIITAHDQTLDDVDSFQFPH